MYLCEGIRANEQGGAGASAAGGERPRQTRAYRLTSASLCTKTRIRGSISATAAGAIQPPAALGSSPNHRCKVLVDDHLGELDRRQPLVVLLRDLLVA